MGDAEVEKRKDAALFIAGFADCVGTIELHPAFPVVNVSFSVLEAIPVTTPPEYLEQIRQRYGGGKYEPTRTLTSYGWKLSLDFTPQSRVLLHELLTYSVLLRKHAEIALDYIAHFSPGKNYTARKVMADADRALPNVALDTQRITRSYLAGVYTAQGDVSGYTRVRPKSKITNRWIEVRVRTNRRHPGYMRALKESTAWGTLSRLQWRIVSRQAAEFLAHVAPFLTGLVQAKVQQAVVAQTSIVRRAGWKKFAPGEETEREKLFAPLFKRRVYRQRVHRNMPGLHMFSEQT